MTERMKSQRSGGALIDVPHAAALLGRHPETIRRWVWSGRPNARRQGNRLLIARADVEALAREAEAAPSLRDWAEQALVVPASGRQTTPRRSAADLVIGDRRQR